MAKLVHSFSQYSVHTFGNRLDWQTYKNVNNDWCMIKITQNQHLAPGAVAIIQFSPCHEAEWPLVTILSLDNRHRQWTDWRVQALTCIMIQHINTKTSRETTTLLQVPLLSVWMYRQWCPLAIVWVRLSTTCMARMDSWVPLHQGYQFWHNTENFLAKTRIISVCMYERSSRTCCIRIHLQMWATQSWWIGPKCRLLLIW